MKSLGLSVVLTGLCGGATVSAQDAIGGVDASTLDVRVTDIAERTRALGADVARARRALGVLGMNVFESHDGAVLSITHDDRVGPLYRLVRAEYALDGRPVFQRADARGILHGEASLDLHAGTIAAGEHLLSVQLEYVGEGGGVVTYLRGYRFSVRSSHAFTVPEGGRVSLRVRTFEHDPATTPYVERLDVAFAEQISE